MKFINGLEGEFVNAEHIMALSVKESKGLFTSKEYPELKKWIVYAVMGISENRYIGTPLRTTNTKEEAEKEMYMIVEEVRF